MPPNRRTLLSRRRSGSPAMRSQIEGSQAVARAVAHCRPEVICAYPISPQTHIVEALSDLVRQGEIGSCEFLNVESEFAALSACIGASATGARTYTATASQGLLYMAEALYNASGLGLPIVMGSRPSTASTRGTTRMRRARCNPSSTSLGGAPRSTRSSAVWTTRPPSSRPGAAFHAVTASPATTVTGSAPTTPSSSWDRRSSTRSTSTSARAAAFAPRSAPAARSKW